ncbi:MAG: C10 family peptidase [Thermoplasmatales archaeon]|nr:MAG: C10 family peptidase [Thermoplasmatales archaeon]
MKKKLIGIFVCMLLIISVLPTICSKIVYEDSINPKFSNYTRGVYMIDTEWGQHGYYKSLCPWTCANHTSRCRLGCWSVAIGQIINYHSDHYSLQSHGYVDYDCTDHTIDPWEIESDLDETDYDWSQMADKLVSGSTAAEKRNVSRLLYDTAIVIQKDFGTMGYLTIENTNAVPDLINELIDHFPSINAFTEWDNDLTEAEIVEEIDHGRPIMFYTVGHNITSGSSFPHAMVIDGYDYTGGPPHTFEVHLNYGWDGPVGLELPNTWYDYYGNFPSYDPNCVFDDPNYRKGLLIRLSPIFTHFGGPACALLGQECQFTVKSDFDTDPPMQYSFDWGDGTNSGWLGPYQLGETCTASNSWQSPGIYEVKVKVKNNMGCESDWSESLTIHITRYGFLLPILEFLIELRDRIPALEPFLTVIINLFCL